MDNLSGSGPSRFTRKQVQERQIKKIKEKELKEKESYESSPSKGTRKRVPIALSEEAIYAQSKKQKRVEETLERGGSISDRNDIMSAVARTASQAVSPKDHDQSPEPKELKRKQSQQGSSKHVRWVDEELGQDLATFQTAPQETKRKESNEGNTRESKRLETQRLERAKLAEDRAKQIELRTQRAKDRAEKKEAPSNEDSPMFSYPESLDLDEEVTDITTTRHDPKQASSATPIEGSPSHSGTESLDLDEIGKIIDTAQTRQRGRFLFGGMESFSPGKITDTARETSPIVTEAPSSPPPDLSPKGSPPDGDDL